MAASGSADQHGGGMTAGLLQRELVQLRGLAEADCDHPRQPCTRCQDGAGLALGAFELGRSQRASNRTAGRLVGLLPQS